MIFHLLHFQQNPSTTPDGKGKEDTEEELNTYECPLYRTSLRASSLTSTGHPTNFVTSVNLQSIQPADYWITRGVALLCQLDEWRHRFPMRCEFREIMNWKVLFNKSVVSEHFLVLKSIHSWNDLGHESFQRFFSILVATRFFGDVYLRLNWNRRFLSQNTKYRLPSYFICLPFSRDIHSFNANGITPLAPVVWRVDNAIHWI